MSDPESASQPVTGSSDGFPAPARVDRARLGPLVAADLEAILNDMEQAKELAAEYQRALAGKSNELASLKQLFEKTRQHLVQLQTNVTNLRDERHRLANEAMRAEALQLKLERVTGERDRLAAERDRLANESTRAEGLQRKLDQVTGELERLRGEQARRMWGD